MSAHVISLFEHQFLSYEQLDHALAKSPPRASIQRERVLSEIEHLNAASGREILRLERKGLRAGSMVGLVRLKEITIEILPKIDYPGPERSISPAQTASRNLLVMLDYVYHLPIIEREAATVDTTRSNWFDLLTHLFARQLHRQVLAGLTHGFHPTQASLPVLRGRWDIQRQMQRRAQNSAAFEVIYDEHSPDIPLNQVLRYVIERLYWLSADSTTRQLLDELRERFRAVSLLPQISPDLLETITFNQLNERYHTAFNLARLFLAGEMMQMAHGSTLAPTFLLDMNVLFEQFVAAFLERHLAAILPGSWENITLRVQSEGMNIHLARWKKRGVFRLRPDLLFIWSGEPVPVLVADTKYKRLDTKQPGLHADPDDFYQLLAYGVRLKCPRGLLIYPQPVGDQPVRRQFSVDAAELDITAATINLHTPLQPPDALIQEMRDIFSFISATPPKDKP